jgi:hypothetical protein
MGHICIYIDVPASLGHYHDPKNAESADVSSGASVLTQCPAPRIVVSPASSITRTRQDKEKMSK